MAYMHVHFSGQIFQFFFEFKGSNGCNAIRTAQLFLMVQFLEVGESHEGCPEDGLIVCEGGIALFRLILSPSCAVSVPSTNVA